MTQGKGKRVSGKVGKWAAAVLSLTHFLTHPLSAADLTKGYTFTSGEQNVTHTKLNNLVDAATINASFFTDKSAVTAPATVDLVLIYDDSASALRKITLGNLLFNNPFTITNLTADTAPAPDDLVATYDVSDTALKKATLRAMVFESAHLIANRTNWPTPARITTSLLAYDSDTGEFSKLTRSNLFYQFYEFNVFTNLANHTNPTNDDKLLLWDETNKTNKTTTLAGLVTNAPANTWTNSGDVLWGYSAESNRVAKLSLPNLAAFVTTSAGFISTASNLFYTNIYQSAETALGTGKLIDAAHGFPTTPREVWVSLKCLTAEFGYSVGDEVLAVGQVNNSTPMYYPGANSTNVFLVASTAAATPALPNKATGASWANLTAGNWRLILRARP
jgi:hypothetical protein